MTICLLGFTHSWNGIEQRGEAGEMQGRWCSQLAPLSLAAQSHFLGTKEERRRCTSLPLRRGGGKESEDLASWRSFTRVVDNVMPLTQPVLAVCVG